MPRSAKWYSDQRNVAFLVISAAIVFVLVVLFFNSSELSSRLRADVTTGGNDCDYTGSGRTPTEARYRAVNGVKNCLAKRRKQCESNKGVFVPAVSEEDGAIKCDGPNYQSDSVSILCSATWQCLLPTNPVTQCDSGSSTCTCTTGRALGKGKGVSSNTASNEAQKDYQSNLAEAQKSCTPPSHFDAGQPSTFETCTGSVLTLNRWCTDIIQSTWKCITCPLPGTPKPSSVVE